jgi:hypothetical protein
MGKSANPQIAGNQRLQRKSQDTILLFVRQPLVARYLLFVILAAVGYWGPWVDHDAAALQLSGQDLGEFVKFIPEISNGQIKFPRQLLYLPPLVCTICVVLLAVNRHLACPRWLRVAMLGLALLLLPGLLPPVWGHPRELFSAEYRLQGIALVLGLAVVLAHGPFRNLSLFALTTTLGALALIGLLPAQGAFWAVRPHIWAAYGTPTIRLGWGLWLSMAAWLGLFVVALVPSQARQEE